MAKVRTQIQLERKQYDRLKRLAVQRRQSLSGVIRSLLDVALDGGPEKQAEIRKIRMAIVGAGRDREGKRDVARNHDKYLYGSR